MAKNDNRWTMSDERAFIENLLYQRINFLIVFCALVVEAAVTAGLQRPYRTIILALGALVCILFATSICLLQPKLEILIRQVRNARNHPAEIVYAELQKNARFKKIHKWGIDRILVGYLVPWTCALSLLIATVWSARADYAQSHSPRCQQVQIEPYAEGLAK
jgi:hypothetical protein